MIKIDVNCPHCNVVEQHIGEKNNMSGENRCKCSYCEKRFLLKFDIKVEAIKDIPND